MTVIFTDVSVITVLMSRMTVKCSVVMVPKFLWTVNFGRFLEKT